MFKGLKLSHLRLNKNYILVMVLVLAVAGLGILSYLGRYDRPQNDDYFYLADSGLTPHSHFFWASNGRLSSLISYYLLYPIPHSLQLAPAFTLLLFFVSLMVFISALIKWQRGNQLRDTLLLSGAIAACLALAICCMLPGLYATFYWFAAVPPHTWSFCLVILYGGLLIHRLLVKGRPLYMDVLTFLIIPFLVGAFYEAGSLILIVSSLVGIIVCRAQKLTRHAKILWFSLIGSAFSMAFLLLSPGATRRQGLSAGQYHDTMLGRVLHLPGALAHNFFYVLPRYLQHPELLLVILAAGIVVGLIFLPRKLSLRTAIWRVVVIVVATLFFVTADMGVTWVGLQEFQTVREYFSLVLGLALGCFLVGIVAGQWASQLHYRHAQKIILGVCASAISVIILINQAYFPVVRHFRNGIISYAKAWDSEDREIKQKVADGQCTITVNGLAISGSWHINSYPRYWVSTAMSEYYRLSQTNRQCSIYASRTFKPFGNSPYFENPPG